MRAAFLVLLLWAVACAHPVPSHEPARLHRSAQQEDTASEDYINQLGNLSGGGGRRTPTSAERGDNALAGELRSRNAVDEEWGEDSRRHKGGRVGEALHLNQVDHKDANAQDRNSIGFLEEDARDADDGDTGEHRGPGVNGFPSHASRLLDEEDDSGDDTFDVNGEEEGSEGPTYMAGADGHDAGRGDAGADRGHGDSSSSSSSESTGVGHWRYRSYPGKRYGQGGVSSSSQEEEESYNFEDEAMQGDDPSVFDGPGSSYKGFRAGPHALGSSREGGGGAGSYRWQEGNSRSPEVEDTDSGEDSPSVENNSKSEEPVDSRSEENSSSHSREDRDGEDSPSEESEDSKSVESTAEQSDEELGESPEESSQEAVSTSSEHDGIQSQEGQEEGESAEARSAPSAPDSESKEDEGDQSKSGEDDGDQSQSMEDTMEESQEDNSDLSEGIQSASAESQSTSPEDDSSREDNAGEDSSSMESNNSESREDDSEQSHSQEDATHESSSRGDNSLPQSLESRSRGRRPGAYRHKPAADYDDNDCQDGY